MRGDFTIVYGITEFGLADQTGVDTDTAVAMIEAFYKTYPGVKKWIDAQKAQILREKVTYSMHGGKRRLYEEVNSGNEWKIKKAFNMGINSVIQRSSAEMVKLATLKLRPLLKELDSRIVLWVHDEIVFDCPENIGMDNLKRIADVMINAVKLDVPVLCDIEVGKKWGQKISEDDVDKMMYGDGEDD